MCEWATVYQHCSEMENWMAPAACDSLADLFLLFPCRSTFKEFSEKYGRDPRFKRVPKQKDQELLFSQFVSGLKKRDKENRLRLRKMRWNLIRLWNELFCFYRMPSIKSNQESKSKLHIDTIFHCVWLSNWNLLQRLRFLLNSEFSEQQTHKR